MKHLTFRVRTALTSALGIIMGGIATRPAAAQTPTPWRPDHIVIVIDENKAFEQIIGDKNKKQAPYINELAAKGALFTDYHALLHPSQPNYIALFSGSTQGIIDDSEGHAFAGDNMGNQLFTAGFS